MLSPLRVAGKKKVMLYAPHLGLKTNNNLEVIYLCVVGLFMAVIVAGNVALFCQIPRSNRCHMGARWAVCQGEDEEEGKTCSTLRMLLRKSLLGNYRKNRELVKKREKLLWSHWVEVKVNSPLKIKALQPRREENCGWEGWGPVTGVWCHTATSDRYCGSRQMSNWSIFALTGFDSVILWCRNNVRVMFMEGIFQRCSASTQAAGYLTHNLPML